MPDEKQALQDGRRGEFSMNVIQEIEQEQLKKLSATKTIPDFGARATPSSSTSR